ncbi:MAG: NepR family anti-sigma factor [Tsuneonella sp.]
MESGKDKNGKKMATRVHTDVGKKAAPGIASGLRQLYDSVLDEPLPDALKDLLSKLDDKN